MLRVGLTGGLGSGKSTAARMFADRGAIVLQSDVIGRELMQPGQAVYAAIVERFGAGVVRPGGQLDRPELARLAFAGGEAEALNAIVHPAVIARQEELMRAMPVDSIVVIESALIFETTYAGAAGWKGRFDKLVLVTAPEALKIARFLERSGATPDTAEALQLEAKRRLALQIPDAEKSAQCDFVVINDGDLSGLERQVGRIWQALVSLRQG